MLSAVLVKTIQSKNQYKKPLSHKDLSIDKKRKKTGQASIPGRHVCCRCGAQATVPSPSEGCCQTGLIKT